MASHTDSPFVRTTTERSSLRNMRSAPIDAAVRGGANRDKESYYHNSGFVSDTPEPRRTLQFAYSVSPPKSHGHGFAYPNGSSSQEKTPSGSVQSPDPYYKTKLRQGFINMRNSYNEKHRHKKSNVTRTLTRTPNTGQPSRLLAVEEKHAPTSVPAGHNEFSSPRYEIAKVTTSHQGHQPSLPDGQHTLYRSNSSLDLGNLDPQEELPRQPVATLHREYGSTSSLDVVNSSFFQMVQRIDQTDQRAPAPPMMQETLRGHVAQSDEDDAKDVSSPEQVPNGNAIIEPDPSSEEVTLSPKLHKKSHKHRDRKSRAKSVVGETSSGIFRRFMGSGKSEAADTSSKPTDTSPDQEGKPEEKQRRKAFVHYDCQSVGFNIHDILKRQNDLNQRRNTSTGASAASVLRTDIATSDNDTSEAGDGKSNDLVLSCSFFRNEIGGEEESTICLNKTTVQQRAQQWLGNKSARTPGQRRKPICNGVAILDTSAIGQGAYPSSVASNKGLVIEYVDAGSYYYRDFFNEQDMFAWSRLPGIGKVYWPVKIVDSEGTSITVYSSSDDAYFTVKEANILEWGKHLSLLEKGKVMLRKKPNSLKAFLDDFEWILTQLEQSQPRDELSTHQSKNQQVESKLSETGTSSLPGSLTSVSQLSGIQHDERPLSGSQLSESPFSTCLQPVSFSLEGQSTNPQSKSLLPVSLYRNPQPESHALSPLPEIQIPVSPSIIHQTENQLCANQSVSVSDVTESRDREGSLYSPTNDNSDDSSSNGHDVDSRDELSTHQSKNQQLENHQNYFGVDDNLGPVAVSIRRERVIERETSSGKLEGGGALFQYRLIVRTSELLTLRGCILEDAIPTSSRLSNTRGLPHKEVLEFVIPELQVSCLKQAIAGPKTYEQLLKLDEQRITKTYKIGIMYCKAGQSTEEEMYNNEEAGPAFEEFLELLGQRVKLKGFEKYLGGLDNKTDSSGIHSVYTSFYGLEIMFHVSTLLPFTENNKQQLMRKRHIGNDIVTIVFQEPNAQPFTPKTVRSHFQHVFIIVRVHHPNTEHVKYSVAVSRSKDVPAFGPPFPDGALFTKSVEFADFLLTKAINAENAAHRSEKFTAMATRTRQEYLKDLANNYVSTTPLDSGSKLSKFSLGSGRKKEKAKSRTIPDMFARGAIVWNVQVEDYSQSQEVDCSLGISADMIVLMEDCTKEVVCAVYCQSVLGWTSQQNSLRLYFDKGESIVITTSNSEVDEVQEIISRLSFVTQGCETKELTLHRQHDQQLGFHVHIEGIVTQVEPYSAAWNSGLRTGSRLVEICKEATASLTHDQMVDLLRKSHTVKIVVIPAHEDGSPRRGIEEPRPGYLSKITASAPAPPPRGQESRMVTGLDPVFACSQNYVDVRAVRVDSSYSAKHNKQSSQDSAASRSSGQGSMDGLATDNRNHQYDIGYASGGTPSGGGTGTKIRLTNISNAASQHDMRMHAYALYGKERAERAGKPSPPSTLETPAQKTSASVSNLSQYSDWSSSRSSSSSGPRQGHRSYANEERRGRSPAVEDIPPPVPPPPVEDLELQEPTRPSHGLQPNLGPRSHHRFPSMSPANSRGSSPATSRMNLSQLPLEDSPRSRGRSKSGHARLVPSRSVQEDLKKLINPDINFTQEQDVSPDPPRGRTNPLLHRTLSEDSLFGIHNKSKPLAMDVSGDVIFTASSSQVPPLKDSTDIENRLSAQATSERSHNLAASTPSLKVSDTGVSQEWSDLVRTATKAMTDERESRQQETNKAKASDTTPRRERSSSRPSPIPTSQDRQSHHASGHDSLERSRGSEHPVDLRARCTQLEEELMKERRLRFEEQQWRMELEEEILRLKEDNIRLQEESQTAAAQLRRFTEWFFNTIDKQ